ncbi:hypothetical protein GHT06_021115 [Daphnia sinensis]|uniref:Uncharacterized protein n=1 Tax=Daphnia sinensis TaxID=1820382 RepID=A0AAD5L0W2_9CRUS|nr:hypothetical protein GHT06_021115 [Daphnia sinensis]
MEDIILPAPNPSRIKVEKEDAPKYTLSKMLQRPNKFLAKKFIKDPDADRTDVVQVVMNGVPVEMVIDLGCFDTIISHQQWKQLGEPTLGALTKGDRVTFRRTGKYKKRVKLEQLAGYFFTTVKLEDCVSVLPIYVCKANKIKPNFLGRRLFHDLRLNSVHAHLIRVSQVNDSPSFPHARQNNRVPEMAAEADLAVVPVNLENSAAEQQPDAVTTEESGVEMETATAAESAPENADVSTANEEPEKEKVADSVTVLQALIDKTKEKNKVKRDKYEKRMAELVPKVTEVQQAELDKLVGLESTENTSESNVPQSDHYANCVALKKAVSQLKSIYKKDQNKADKVLRGATVQLTALKKEIARTPLNSKWIELTDDAERKEKALQVVTDQVAADFAEKMKTLSDAKGILPKLTPATKVKYFFKNIFGIKQKN